jgi:hypothetical protein
MCRVCATLLLYTRLEQLRGNMHTNEAHKNNTTPTYIGINKITRETRTPQEKIKSDVPKQMYFNA